MPRSAASNVAPVIRPLQYRDLDELRQWRPEDIDAGETASVEVICAQLEHLRRWYGPLKLASWLPHSIQAITSTFVAEYQGQLVGLIRVSPFNRGRSTWQVEQVFTNRAVIAQGPCSGFMDAGSRLLRYCFEQVWEARTWLSEVNIHNKSALALYRFNGFQPLAQVTYWSVSSERLQALAEREPDLPNLLPVGNADAQLLYQLTTASMPPLVRQVFDQQIQDFKGTLLGSIGHRTGRWMNRTETLSAYVFEHQRKAAIGHFQLTISRHGQRPHEAELTVHPAYTWLYPELLAQMARVLQPFPAVGLRLASLDYQPEREEFLHRIHAEPETQALLMSRSVWHKVRETRPVVEGLQLSEVLSGLKPAGKPVPGRMSWWESWGSWGQPDAFQSVRWQEELGRWRRGDSGDGESGYGSAGDRVDGDGHPTQ